MQKFQSSFRELEFLRFGDLRLAEDGKAYALLP